MVWEKLHLLSENGWHPAHSAPEATLPAYDQKHADQPTIVVPWPGCAGAWGSTRLRSSIFFPASSI